jgi:hypothetical protein
MTTDAQEPEVIAGIRAAVFAEAALPTRIEQYKEILAAYDALTQQRDEARRDAARYRWLNPRLLGVDWAYGDPSESVLMFTVPEGMTVSADLDATIDAARTADAGASDA